MKQGPSDEARRLEELASFDILGTDAEQAFDDLAVLAAYIFGVPTALVSLVDVERQWFKARVGLDARETDRASSFCAHAILQPEQVFVVEDAMADERFAGNALVTGDPYIRFYAGAPIVTESGVSPGTVCVIDTTPRTPTQAQLIALQLLARQAAALLTLRRRTREAEEFARQRDAAVAASAEQQRKSEELLELVLRGGDLGVWDLDPQSGIWVTNSRELEMLGYGPEAETSELDWNSLIHPDDLVIQRSAFLSHLRGATPFAESTYRIRRQNGSWIWVLERSVVVERDAVGRAKRVVGTHMNVTVHKEREAERVRSSARLELAVTAGALGLWDLDVTEQTVVYSDRWRALVGYEPDENPVPRSFWQSMVHPDDLAAARAGVAAHLAGITSVYEGEVRLRHKDGRWLWIYDRAKVVERDNGGNALRVVGVSSDVTSRKAIEAALAVERHRLQMISDNMPALIMHVDREERYTFANAHHDRVFGFPASALLGKTMRQACGETVYAGIAPFIAQALSGERVRFEAAGPAKGATVYYESHYIPDVDAAGNVLGFYAMVFDISERKAAEQALLEQQDRLRGITDNVPALIAELDQDWRFTFCNAMYREWLGIEPESMIGKQIVEALGEEFTPPQLKHLKHAYAGKRVDFEQRVSLAIGERYLQTTYIPQLRVDGSVRGLYALSHDISKLKDVQNELSAMAREDPLTGLPNRRVLKERLEHAIARMRRLGDTVAVLYIDIDHFKSINDTGGHAVGDVVLVEFARRLTQCVRQTDTVARYAGDEFVILLEGLVDGRVAPSIAAKIVAGMGDAFNTSAGPYAVTASIGIAVHQGDEQTAEALLNAADKALYEAKAKGRNRYAVAGHHP